MDDCPTALLVDLTEPLQTMSPRTPGRKTPHRACKRVMSSDLATTPKRHFASPKPRMAESVSCESMDADEPKEDMRKDSIDSYMLEQETFDFDLSLSPETNKKSDTSETKLSGLEEDDEEIFFGPVGHREKCIAKAVEEEQVEGVRPLSPLTASQLVMLFKEAQTVAFHIKARGTPQKTKKSSQSSTSSGSSGPLGCSPVFSTDSPLLGSQKRKLSLDEDEPEVKSFRLDASPPTQKEPTVLDAPKKRVDESKRTLKKPVGAGAGRGLKRPAAGSGLQRSASFKLPRPQLQNKLANSPESGTPRPGSRTRHVSAGPTPNTPSDKRPAVPLRPTSSASAKRKSEESAGESGHDVSANGSLSQRKLPRILPNKGLVKPCAVTRKPLAPPSSSKQPVRVLPKGPLKATAPVKGGGSTSFTEPSGVPTMVRRSLSMRGGSVSGGGRPGSPKYSTSSSTSSTPGQSLNTSRRSSTSGTPIKQEKSVNPKRLLTSPPNPSQCRSVNQRPESPGSNLPSLKRKSFLPTSGKNSSFSSTGSSRNLLSSVSSNDSTCSSPGASEPTSKLMKFSKARRSLQTNPRNKENSRLASPATRLASKLKPLRISDNGP